MIAAAWDGNHAVITTPTATVRIDRTEAARLAQDLRDGTTPTCWGYPMPDTCWVGEHVIAEVTLVAGDRTVIRVAWFRDDGEYVDTEKVTLTPDQRHTLIAQLQNGGTQ